MKNQDINIRDPFVLREGDQYYMYGSRARNFAVGVGGFDVYVSQDLENWSDPIPCFDSEAYGLNRAANWAPEVHKYQGKYYMFATFTRENGLRGTFALRADKPEGPFVPHSKGQLTPEPWECLDGTLHVNKEGKPFLVFCHEHTQIIDGTICYVPLTDDLTAAAGEPVVLFAASRSGWSDPLNDGHYVTDGPFLYRGKTGELFMIWSSFIKGDYTENLVRFENGELGTAFTHLTPLITNDGGHGMIFEGPDGLCITYHTPNTQPLERPAFWALEDLGDTLALKG